IRNAHHFARRAHLGPQDRIHAPEFVERKHGRLHRIKFMHGHFGNAIVLHQGSFISASLRPAIKRAATFASGTPVALLTYGTVRDARGFTSSTYTVSR